MIRTIGPETVNRCKCMHVRDTSLLCWLSMEGGWQWLVTLRLRARRVTRTTRTGTSSPWRWLPAPNWTEVTQPCESGQKNITPPICSTLNRGVFNLFFWERHERHGFLRFPQKRGSSTGTFVGRVEKTRKNMNLTEIHISMIQNVTQMVCAMVYSCFLRFPYDLFCSKNRLQCLR